MDASSPIPDDVGPLPDPTWSIREPTPEDADAIAALINEVTVREIGVRWTTAEEERDALTSPGGEHSLPETLVLDRDGDLIGYTNAMASSGEEVHLLVFTHPRVWGSGLSAWLIRLEEARVRERRPAGSPVRVSAFSGNEAAFRLFRSLGYEHVRTFWVMEITLEDAPPRPTAAKGIDIRSFERGRDERAVYAALSEAFEDHWGSGMSSFERWVHTDVEGSRSDLSVWFVATDGDEIVGAATCTTSSPHDDDAAQVTMLGVRREWRRRGVALALLRTAFTEFHRRGIPRAELGVDSSNPTGATRLYERAGMHVVRSWEVWEKRVSAA